MHWRHTPRLDLGISHGKMFPEFRSHARGKAEDGGEGERAGGGGRRVLGSGVFELDLHHFQNTNGLLANGLSCSMTGCRTYFRVCLKNFQTVVSPGKCIFGKATTPVLGTDSFSIKQDARLRLPLNFTWPGAFSLVIEAWYSPAADLSGDTTNPDFLISSFAIQRQLGIGHEWSQLVQNGTQTELRYSYRFICKDNYYGDTCSKICAPRDDHFGHYTCKSSGQIACLPGWKGEYCQEHLNYCTHNKPCTNGATCMNTGEGSYTCTCLPGFTGVNCDLEVRECDSQPCRNGGRCMDSENGYRCVCPQGFEGTHCEHRMLTCADTPCFHGGKCREKDNGHAYTCECPAGYTGLNCEKKVDKCTSLQCANDRCASQPCLNGGTCTTGAKGQPTCICPAHYSGPQCQSVPDVPSPNIGLESNDKLNLAAIGLGVGLVAVLVFFCMLVVVIRHIKKQRNKKQDSDTMNNLSKGDFQKENLISTLELKNNNKKIDLEVDCPREKSNHKHINHYHLDYKTSTGYKDELSLLDKDENCEKAIEEKKHLSRMYSERPECRISTICSSGDSMYQSVFVIAEEKNECIIATEPGRVVTLVEDQEACTWGVAYEVADSQIEESLQYLNMREVVLGGYITEMVEFIPQEKGQAPLLALVYIATSDNPIYLGPASEKEIAAQISACRGNTGHNIEYLLRLAEFMRLYCPEVEDEHLFSIEAAVLNIFHDCGEINPRD
ncbi:Delta-like protein 4 [Collichthys lucidus]|uniref:Delta-like protein n=1 Tax=Collichthys lucidus TaxID=240159 RepID=A0A4V6ASX8_COLLU|nr:Delta-like protein 4 [Collichthys lucidus]